VAVEPKRGVGHLRPNQFLDSYDLLLATTKLPHKPARAPQEPPSAHCLSVRPAADGCADAGCPIDRAQARTAQSSSIDFCTAEMLAVMLAFGVVSRLIFGWVLSRIGGLPTLLLGSTMQDIALALSAFRRARFALRRFGHLRLGAGWPRAELHSDHP
jgi:hypothetical protein